MFPESYFTSDRLSTLSLQQGYEQVVAETRMVSYFHELLATFFSIGNPDSKLSFCFSWCLRPLKIAFVILLGLGCCVAAILLPLELADHHGNLE